MDAAAIWTAWIAGAAQFGVAMPQDRPQPDAKHGQREDGEDDGRIVECGEQARQADLREQHAAGEERQSDEAPRSATPGVEPCVNQVFFMRGSSTSRSPSPRKLNPITVNMMARPGKMPIHADWRK